MGPAFDSRLAHDNYFFALFCISDPFDIPSTASFFVFHLFHITCYNTAYKFIFLLVLEVIFHYSYGSIFPIEATIEECHDVHVSVLAIVCIMSPTFVEAKPTQLELFRSSSYLLSN